jgi:hypothetical protein
MAKFLSRAAALGLVLSASTAAAYAEATGTGGDGFATWGMVGSFGGMVVIVSLIAQFCKGFAPSIDPKWWVLIGSVAANVAKLAVIDGMTAANGLLCAFNVVVVYMAAIGAYETAKSAKKTPDQPLG